MASSRRSITMSMGLSQAGNLDCAGRLRTMAMRWYASIHIGVGCGCDGSPNCDIARGTLLRVVHKPGSIGAEFTNHRNATSGPGSQYIIAQLTRAVSVQGLESAKRGDPGVLGLDCVPGGGVGGCIASRTNASKPEGESHNANEIVCGRSRCCCCCDPGDSGGVRPAT